MEDGHKPAGKVVNKLTSVMHFYIAITGHYFNGGLIKGFFCSVKTIKFDLLKVSFRAMF